MAMSNPALLLLLLVSAVALQFQPIRAQQEYNNVAGYLCTGVQQKCTAYAYYRTQGTNSTLNSTAALFSTTAAAVANASNMTSATANALLADKTGLTIPLNCGCANGTYQAPTTYTVVSDDTMAIIANRTFEGLVSYQAIMAANPTIVPQFMGIGVELKIPVRCACPSQPQIVAGTESLLSYAVFPGEDLTTISQMYAVSVTEVQTANTWPNTTVEAFSTVLIPLKGSSNGSIAPAASPNSASGGSRTHLLGVVALLAAQSLLF